MVRFAFFVHMTRTIRSWGGKNIHITHLEMLPFPWQCSKCQLAILISRQCSKCYLATIIIYRKLRPVSEKHQKIVCSFL